MKKYKLLVCLAFANTIAHYIEFTRDITVKKCHLPEWMNPQHNIT